MKHLLTTIFMFCAITLSAQQFSVIDGSDMNLKYKHTENYTLGEETYEFYENGIKYMFIKSNLFGHKQDYIYLEYDMINKIRLITIEGEEAEWIQDDYLLTCSGIDRKFMMAKSNGDK